MSWLGLILLVVCAWLAFKLVGALLKLLMFVLALVGAYWFLAPHLGWPTVSELFYVLGPDFGGRRIEEVADPKALTKQAADHVVDSVIGQVKSSVGTFVSGQELEPAVDLETVSAPVEPSSGEGPVQEGHEAGVR